jgi:hypothetical protein
VEKINIVKHMSKTSQSYLGGGLGVLAGAFFSHGFFCSGFLALGAATGGGGGSSGSSLVGTDS